MRSRRLTRLIAGGGATIALAVGAYGIVTAKSGNTSAAAPRTATAPALASRPGPGGRLSGPRSGPAAGGAVGTVASVSRSSFTITTPAGQTVGVQKRSSTAYRNGTRTIAASAIKKGVTVLVLGTTDGTTITATQVVVQPTNGSGSTSVVPFQRGAPSTSKQVGQIPASYAQGSGTIAGGTTANRATKAALAAYPGGIVDRVVKLSDGEFEVHNIGVSWPHHIFVDQSFKVVGAN